MAFTNLLSGITVADARTLWVENTPEIRLKDQRMLRGN